MSRVAIFTDSASDLDPARSRPPRGSAIVPLLVTFGAETFKAGVDMSTDGVLGADGRPGRAVPEDRRLVARRVQGGLRGGLRGRRRGDRLDPRRRARCRATIKSAQIARDMLPDREIHVVDSLGASMAEGILARMARRARRRGPVGRGDRRDASRRGRRDMRMYVALETLEYLKKGGRISGAQAAIGTLLSVKPIIRGQRTAWSRRSTGSGPARKARERLIELICERPIERLAILHTVSPDVEAFRDEVLRPGARRARPGRRLDQPRRRVGRAAPRPGLRRRGGPVPGLTARRIRARAARRGRATLRQGCDNLADRYHRAGANRRVAAILGPQMKSRAAVTIGPTGPGGAPRGVVRETTRTDGGRSTARHVRTLHSMTTEHVAARDQRLGSRAATVRPRRRSPGPGRGHAPRPARAAPRADRPFPGPHGRRIGPGLHRLPRPAQPRPRPGQGRHPLPPGRLARRGQGPRDVDDLEVRGRRHPVRRRQGRRHRRSQAAQPEGARGPDPPLLHRDRGPRRPGEGHPGAGRQHQRPDHGLDDGHLLHARRLHGPGRRHRQADQPRRLRGPQRGDGPRLRLHHRRGGPPPRAWT